MKYLPKTNSGQALLLVLLSMAVVLTIVLSVISRSVTDISVTTTSEDSLRAFSAAEAGVEQALIAGGNIPETPLGDAKFITSVSGFASGSKEVLYPASLSAGEVGVIWFVSHDGNGNPTCADGHCFTGRTFKVCWGKAGTSGSSATTPAIEVSFFYKNPAVKIARATLDSNSSRRGSNSFSAPDAGTCSFSTGETFAFGKTLDLSGGGLGIPASVYNNQDGLQYAAIRFLYNDGLIQPFGVNVDFTGNSLLPSQGVKINSQGTSGEANRRVEVIQGYAQLPDVFDSVIFSPEGVSQ